MYNDLKDRFNRFADRYKLKNFTDIFLFILLLSVFSLVGIIWKHYFDYKMFGIHILNPTYDFLIRYIVIITAWTLNLFGMGITTDLELARLYFSGLTRFIYIWHGCSGLREIAMFIFLMALFPGPWKHKLWFIPSGVVLIYVIAVLRIIFLCVVFVYKPEWFDFLHNFLINIFFFFVFFVLWLYWVKYFYLKYKKTS